MTSAVRTATDVKHGPRASRPPSRGFGGTFDLLGAASDLSVLTLAVLLAAPVVAAAVFYVWTHVATVHRGYELSAADDVHQALLEENRGLRIEVAALKRPDRLERLARERYRLRRPTKSQVIRIDMGSRP